MAVNSRTILFAILRNTSFLEQSDFSCLGFSGVQDATMPRQISILTLLELEICKWINWTLSCENLSSGCATQGYKTFLCSTQLSMTFQMLIKTIVLKILFFISFNLSDAVFITLINGILTFMSMKNFIFSYV